MQFSSIGFFKKRAGRCQDPCIPHFLSSDWFQVMLSLNLYPLWPFYFKEAVQMPVPISSLGLVVLLLPFLNEWLHVIAAGKTAWITAGLLSANNSKKALTSFVLSLPHSKPPLPGCYFYLMLNKKIVLKTRWKAGQGERWERAEYRLYASGKGLFLHIGIFV